MVTFRSSGHQAPLPVVAYSNEWISPITAKHRQGVHHLHSEAVYNVCDSCVEMYMLYVVGFIRDCMEMIRGRDVGGRKKEELSIFSLSFSRPRFIYYSILPLLYLLLFPLSIFLVNHTLLVIIIVSIYLLFMLIW